MHTQLFFRKLCAFIFFKKFKFIGNIIRWCFYPKRFVFTFAILCGHHHLEAYTTLIRHKKIHNVSDRKTCSSHSPADKSKTVDCVSMSTPFLLAKASQVRFSVMPIGYFIISCFDLQIYFILMIRTNIHLISFIKKKMCIFDI